MAISPNLTNIAVASEHLNLPSFRQYFTDPSNDAVDIVFCNFVPASRHPSISQTWAPEAIARFVSETRILDIIPKAIPWQHPYQPQGHSQAFILRICNRFIIVYTYLLGPGDRSGLAFTMFAPNDAKATPRPRRSGSYNFSSLPPHAPPLIVKNTTTLQDPSSIPSFSQAQRHREFNVLVKKYIHQLLHGCNRPVCTTPTCATARRQLHARKDATTGGSSASKREFTPLSARIIACQLATADEPYRSLCPGLAGEVRKELDLAAGPAGGRLKPDLGMRDPKSFMQGLFNTTAVRGLEMSVLPPPRDMMDVMVKGESASKVRKESAERHRRISSEPTRLDQETKKDQTTTTAPKSTNTGESYTPATLPNHPTTDRDRTTSGHIRPTYQLSTPPPHQSWSPQPTKSSRRKLSHDLSSYLTSPKNTFFTPDVNDLKPPPPQHVHRHSARDITHRRSIDTTPSRVAKPFALDDKSSKPTTSPVQSRNTIPTPQAVTHFTVDIVSALIEMLDDTSASKSAKREAEGFLRQSCHYVFSRPENLANCFPEDVKAEKGILVSNSMKALFDRGFGREIVDSLWKALGDLFPTVEEVNVGEEKSKVVNPSKYGSELAAKVFTITLHVLTAACPIKTPEVWEQCRRERSRGSISLDISFEDEGEMRLAKRFARCWSAFGLFQYSVKEILKGYMLGYAKVERSGRAEKLERELGRELASEVVLSGVGKGGWGLVVCVMEWMRAIMLSEWDGGERPRSGGVVDASIAFLRFLYEDHEALGLEESYFHNQVLADRLEYKNMPVKWYLKKLKANTTPTLLNTPPAGTSPPPRPLEPPHLLNHAFLLPPSALVKFFRSINFHRMSAAYDDALAMYRFVNQMADVTRRDNFKPWLRNFIMQSYDIAMNMYLCLEVHRSSVVMDTLNQLVGRELRECLRPLKVRFLDVGEEGVDHGGVQQEYFRLIWEEVTKGEYGCFVSDERTRMSWFSIVTLEPMHKFELLGLLVGLAVYNGVTLPVSFPLVMYRKLLGWKVELEDLGDGWPELVKGMKKLLEWSDEDGDVGDIFVRSYEFGYEALGEVHSVDLMKVGREDRWAPMKIEKERVTSLANLNFWLPANSFAARDYRNAMRTQAAAAGPSSTSATRLAIPQQITSLSSPAGEEAQEFLTAMNTAQRRQVQNIPDVADSISTSDTSSRRILTPEILTPGSQSPPASPSRRSSAVAIDENDEAAATWKAYHKQQQSISSADTSSISSTSPVKITSDKFMKPETEESELVTNANRDQYVKDYVFWLTDKSVRPQFEAFERGFHAMLDRKSLSLFNPITLRHLVEGSKEIDIAALEAAAKYDDGYHPNHRCIKDFWAIVRTYDNDQKRALLEFVTASDRVPVSGISSIMFVIQRNGGDSERVPTSLTCFGRLLLPEYSGRKKMREKLRIALENGRGFGVP
ncbi:hypothetical protein TWF788_005469 [Orbilia oligospora]|nr:hypothetical protein TWF788_005469 [Orbilia oligospora]